MYQATITTPGRDHTPISEVQAEFAGAEVIDQSHDLFLIDIGEREMDLLANGEVEWTVGNMTITVEMM